MAKSKKTVAPPKKVKTPEPEPSLASSDTVDTVFQEADSSTSVQSSENDENVAPNGQEDEEMDDDSSEHEEESVAAPPDDQDEEMANDSTPEQQEESGTSEESPSPPPVAAVKQSKAPRVAQKPSATVPAKPTKKASAAVGKKKRAGKIVKRKSKSDRAGLVFPVTRIRNALKDMCSGQMRIQTGAAVYMAGALEYLVTELSEIGSEIAISMKRTRITPRHIMLAVERDDELKELLKDVTFPQAGVAGHIHPALLPKKSRKSS